MLYALSALLDKDWYEVWIDYTQSDTKVVCLSFNLSILNAASIKT